MRMHRVGEIGLDPDCARGPGVPPSAGAVVVGGGRDITVLLGNTEWRAMDMALSECTRRWPSGTLEVCLP